MKFKIVSGIVMTTVVIMLYVLFAGEEPEKRSSSQTQTTDQDSGYSGLGK